MESPERPSAPELTRIPLLMRRVLPWLARAERALNTLLRLPISTCFDELAKLPPYIDAVRPELIQFQACMDCHERHGRGSPGFDRRPTRGARCFRDPDGVIAWCARRLQFGRRLSAWRTVASLEHCSSRARARAPVPWPSVKRSISMELPPRRSGSCQSAADIIGRR